MKNKKKYYVAIAVFIAVFCTLSFSQFYDGYKTDHTITSQIEESLKANCNCETVSKDMYSKGIQYSMDEGFSIEKVSFILKNCTFKSLEAEAQRIHKMLLSDVDDIKTFNLITLEIISEDRHNTVTIKNGKLEF